MNISVPHPIKEGITYWQSSSVIKSMKRQWCRHSNAKHSAHILVNKSSRKCEDSVFQSEIHWV